MNSLRAFCAERVERLGIAPEGPESTDRLGRPILFRDSTETEDAGISSLVDFLSRSPWYPNLSGEQKARVRSDCFDRSYHAGSTVCHRGDPADHWLAVVDGIIKVDTASSAGRTVTFAGVPAGSWFGEGAVLKEEPRPYSVVAVRDSRLAFVPRSTFLWLLDHSSQFSRYVIDQLNARCGYYVGLVHNLRLHEASARVAFCLAEMFNQQLYPATDRILGLSQEEIGRLSGLSRQNTNRALRDLADAKLIAVEYGAIQIMDLGALRRFAHLGD